MPHRRLLAKLEALGEEGEVSKWVRSFLSSRKQRVNIRGAFSEWVQVWIEVPQGRV